MGIEGGLGSVEVVGMDEGRCKDDGETSGWCGRAMGARGHVIM
jgi:hypothetical protein